MFVSLRSCGATSNKCVYVCVSVHFILSRRQIESTRSTLPKRHATLSSCRQTTFKFNTSCSGCSGGGVHYWPASRDAAVALRPLSASSRCTIRMLLERNQAPSDFLANDNRLRRPVFVLVAVPCRLRCCPAALHAPPTVLALLQRRPLSDATQTARFYSSESALAVSFGRLCPVCVKICHRC